MSDDKEQMPPPPSTDDDGGQANYPEEGYTPEVDAASAESTSFSGDSTVSVSATGNKNVVVLGIVGLIFVFLIYQVFLAEEELPPPTPLPKSQDKGASVAPGGQIPELDETAMGFPSLPQLPRLEPEEPVDQVDIVPPMPPAPPAPDFAIGGIGPSNEELQQRRASDMLIIDGGDSGDEVDPTAREGVTTSAERAIATKVGDLNTLVLQGKVIDAVLETALDTTLPGPLRAVVAHDVYAESGYDVLIPKGSRLIGTYNADVVRGQARVFIVWNRLIRPDGVDVQLESQAIDRLGRSGITGMVDERYFEIFGGAILTSILGITLAGVADAILDPEESTQTTNTDGSTTTSGSAVDSAIEQSVTNIGSVSQNVLSGILDTRPNITVDQGTPLKVFVNRDLEFPIEVSNQDVRIIQ